MAKMKLAALISVLGLMGSLVYSSSGLTQTPAPTLRLSTNPATGKVLPFEAEANQKQTPVQFNLQAIAPDGQPLKNAQFHLRLLTPPANPWLPTDFPLVEGTQLLEMTAIAPDGQLQFAQMLPIRGTYQLEVEVTPTVANAFQPFRQTLTLPVAEHGAKYRNFGILMVILLGAGLGGGWVIGRQPTNASGETLTTQVRLLLSGAAVVAIAALLVVNVSAELAESHSHSHAHEHDHSEGAATLPSRLSAQGLELEILGHTHAVVGEPARLTVQLRDRQTGQPVTDAELEIQTTSVEGEWQAFAYRAVTDAQGQFIWQPQFFDGAPHRVEAIARPQPGSARQFQPLQVAQVIEVEGVAPPLQLRLLVLGYFLSILVVGLMGGFWFRQRQDWLDTKAAN